MAAERDTDATNLSAAKRKELGVLWAERIRESGEREQEWRNHANAAEVVFANQPRMENNISATDPRTRFNILHSNVETIVPAIYNSSPEPDIRPRWGSDDEQGPEGQPNPVVTTGRVLERGITVQTDDNKLDEAVEMTAQDSFLAGRGILRVHFDADVEEDVLVDEETGEEQVIGQQSVNERLSFESVSWRDFRMGPATRWEDVPWVAFRRIISNETMKDLGGAEMLKYDITNGGYDSEMSEDERERLKNTISIWEIWCKTTKTVKFLREADSVIIKVGADPFELKDFFPMPPVMQPIRLNGQLTPVCPYAIYQDLAEELDNISKRIARITDGLKVRGGIAGFEGTTVDALSNADDNEMVVIPNMEAMAQNGGLDNAIMWWPIDLAVQVLAQLYQNREMTKQAIYEITGIADVMRGQSDPLDGVGTNAIKTQWGTLRVQKMQRMVQRMVRDTFVVLAQILAGRFSDETLAMMTGLEITPEVRQLLDNPVMSTYRVDIESDSTIRADLTKDRSEMSAFLEGTAQFFGTMAPIIQQDPNAAETVTEIYASFSRYYKLGKQAEDALQRMTEQAKREAQERANNPQPSPEEQMEMEQHQLQMAETRAKIEGEQAKVRLELEKLRLEAQKLAVEIQKAQIEARAKGQELGIKRDEFEVNAIKVEADILKDQQEIELEREQKRAVGIGQ